MNTVYFGLAEQNRTNIMDLKNDALRHEMHQDLSLNGEYTLGYFIVEPNSKRLSQKKTIHALMKFTQSSPLISSSLTATPPFSTQYTQAVIY